MQISRKTCKVQIFNMCLFLVGGANDSFELWWQNGHLLGNYSNWHPDQKLNMEGCVVATKENNFTWTLDKCDMKLPFFCEVPG